MAIVEDLSTETPRAAQLLGKDLVLWRDGQGSWQAHEDVCPHRCSMGPAVFVCALHGIARGQRCPQVQVQHWAGSAHRHRQHRVSSACRLSLGLAALVGTAVLKGTTQKWQRCLAAGCGQLQTKIPRAVSTSTFVTWAIASYTGNHAACLSGSVSVNSLIGCVPVVHLWLACVLCLQACPPLRGQNRAIRRHPSVHVSWWAPSTDCCISFSVCID